MDHIAIESIPATPSTHRGHELSPLPSSTKAKDAALPPSPTPSASDNEDLEVGDIVPQRTKIQLFTILAMLNFSVFLSALDTTITTTAIPTIASAFNSSTGYTWIGSSYLLATAASTPSWGKVSDIFGRKPTLLLGLGVFFTGSLVCAVARNMSTLIAGRAIQGTGGGGILVLASIVAGDLYSLRSRGAVFSVQALVYAVAAAVGPVIGGVCAEILGWRWCFYNTLPSPILAIVVLSLYLELPSPRTPLVKGLLAVDWAGSVAIVAATVSLLMGLEFGGVIFAWDSLRVVALLMVGVVMTGFFFWNEKAWARWPLMPLRLFGSRSNIAAIFVGFFHGMTFFAPSYYLPLLYQSVHVATPLHSGLLTLPYELSLSLSAGLSGLLVKRTGRYLFQIYIGFSLLVTCLILLAIFTKPSTPIWGLVLIEIVGGMGSGLTFSPPLLALQSGTLGTDNATATATFRFVRELATAISIVLGGVVFQNCMQSQQAHLIAQLGKSTAEMFSGKEAAANVLEIAGLAVAEGAVVKGAYASALMRMWCLFVGTGVLGLLCAAGVRSGVLSEVHTEGVVGITDVKEGEGGEARGGVVES